ncbi:MAG: hypothetical protein JWN03_7500 [Nocardia sp.]|nr:hypothetical protein [Nocardia sp.]MCU1647225.1 hypothetical protein [Nocardia sp.]
MQAIRTAGEYTHLFDTDPHSREFIAHYGDQIALLARYLGLDPA